jgi:thiamine monophosphate kinase
VDIEVDPGAVPVAEGATTEQAITGGDDYELCFTAPDPATVRASFAQAGLREPAAIGTTSSGSDARLGGEALKGGWEHPLR